MSIPGPFADPDPVRRRELGLQRVSSTTRWTATAAAAGVLLLGAGYAHALPGVANASTGNVRHPQRTDDTLTPPTQPPVPATQPAQTTTGAS